MLTKGLRHIVDSFGHSGGYIVVSAEGCLRAQIWLCIIHRIGYHSLLPRHNLFVLSIRKAQRVDRKPNLRSATSDIRSSFVSRLFSRPACSAPQGPQQYYTIMNDQIIRNKTLMPACTQALRNKLSRPLCSRNLPNTHVNSYVWGERNIYIWMWIEWESSLSGSIRFYINRRTNLSRSYNYNTAYIIEGKPESRYDLLWKFKGKYEW